MASSSWVSLLFAFALLALQGLAFGEDDFDFNLEDALEDPTEKPKAPVTPRPTKGLLTTTTTKAPKVTQPDFSLLDILSTTTKKPKGTKAPPKKNTDPLDFDLSDALVDNDDGIGSKGKDNRGDFSDDDLKDVIAGGYTPDKNKDGSNDPARGGGNVEDPSKGYDNTAETGTIAGIVSALAMALVGAVTSYISYQQKKFCFSIQQSLNAEYVKGENMEAGIAEEPQAERALLETQSAQRPTEDATKI
ncbi:CD99 antigen-like protein 2 isoform X2 [Latimeria chalumnae]|uniref:CD99 antigen-like protein 2 n=1 Tax=Latimeria chalumnae TaxID=7897 RepID=H3B4E9_LATCH|nr:PREDICTED: CD99 antigen-like protein 2 isoform X2 [Latimeria chalumnae]|eukprot:XP_005991910.1 PREDICTED: CD99 antigen-like protein 2 isoform X2 [Latimeria chalumnae]